MDSTNPERALQPQLHPPPADVISTNMTPIGLLVKKKPVQAHNDSPQLKISTCCITKHDVSAVSDRKCKK